MEQWWVFKYYTTAPKKKKISLENNSHAHSTEENRDSSVHIPKSIFTEPFNLMVYHQVRFLNLTLGSKLRGVDQVR